MPAFKTTMLQSAIHSEALQAAIPMTSGLVLLREGGLAVYFEGFLCVCFFTVPIGETCCSLRLRSVAAEVGMYCSVVVMGRKFKSIL